MLAFAPGLCNGERPATEVGSIKDFTNADGRPCSMHIAKGAASYSTEPTSPEPYPSHHLILIRCVQGDAGIYDGFEHQS
jgi:hypothetical protein